MTPLQGLAFTKAALSSLEGIPKKTRAQVVKKAKKLADDPHPNGAKKIQGAADGANPVYRIRSGDYRILYAVRPGPNIIILDIGDRKDIYRGLS